MKFVIIGINECGEDFHAGEFTVMREQYEDSDIWEAICNTKLSRCYQEYEEARSFSIERKIGDMSLSELEAMSWDY